ncbi:MAG: response regulator [Pseudomonadota bacterium]
MLVKTYTTGEVASLCGVNFRTVIRWIQRGKLKGHKLPGRGDHRVQETDLIVFLRENELPIPRQMDNQNRVLIVDDEPAMVRAIERALKRQGFETATAADGFHAGTLLRDFAPGVMTLDLQMPGLGGLNVLRLIRADSRYANLRVLVVSGLAEPQLEEALAAGADAVLRKPFDDASLVDAVAALAGTGR